MKKFLLTLLGVFLALPTFARDFTYEYEGQTITYTVIDEDDKTVKTKEGKEGEYGSPYLDVLEAEAGNKVAGSLILPSNPKDGTTEYTLIEIGSFSFTSCSELTSVTIPNTVEVIGSGAFALTGLTSIVNARKRKSLFR